MTRKHFEKLAAALRAVESTNVGQWTADVKAVADVCASENTRFNRAKFLEACGMEVA